MYYATPTLFLFTFGISCVIGSGLHGPCESDEDCGTIDTFCSNNTCACKEHFTVFYDSCVPLARPSIRCTDRNQCQQAMGVKSMCTKKKHCACKPFHHLHLGQCVKNRDLHDKCEHDHQCYCGAGCEDKIGCIGRNCTCKRGHKPYRSRQCIVSDDPIDNISPTTTQSYIHETTTSAITSTQYFTNETLLPNGCKLFLSSNFVIYTALCVMHYL